MIFRQGNSGGRRSEKEEREKKKERGKKKKEEREGGGNPRSKSQVATFLSDALVHASPLATLNGEMVRGSWLGMVMVPNSCS